MEPIVAAPHKTRPHLDFDPVPAGGAGGNLPLQFVQLRGAWGATVLALQPMAQHVGLAARAELLQRAAVPAGRSGPTM